MEGLLLADYICRRADVWPPGLALLAFFLFFLTFGHNFKLFPLSLYQREFVLKIESPPLESSVKLSLQYMDPFLK